LTYPWPIITPEEEKWKKKENPRPNKANFKR
jgi:hypothetical protein